MLELVLAVGCCEGIAIESLAGKDPRELSLVEFGFVLKLNWLVDELFICPNMPKVDPGVTACPTPPKIRDGAPDEVGGGTTAEEIFDPVSEVYPMSIQDIGESPACKQELESALLLRGDAGKVEDASLGIIASLLAPLLDGSAIKSDGASFGLSIGTNG